MMSKMKTEKHRLCSYRRHTLPHQSMKNWGMGFLRVYYSFSKSGSKRGAANLNSTKPEYILEVIDKDIDGVNLCPPRSDIAFYSNMSFHNGVIMNAQPRFQNIL